MVFGAHESIAGGIFTAITRGQKATCDALQVFTKSNSQWAARQLDEEEIERFFALIEETRIPVVCSHASYLINLASPDRALNRKSFSALKEEVRRCQVLRIPNLVFHPGAHVGSGEEAGIHRIAGNINRLFDEMPDTPVTLCLETTAGQGSSLGHRFEQLAYIIDRVENRAQVGVCMDTCHIFAAGYAIADPAQYRKTIREFRDVVGLERLKVMHVNDSKREFGSRVDRHEQIGKGEIGIEAFRNVVNDRRLKKVPMIIETPKGEDLAEDVENLRVLRSLVKRRAPSSR